MDWQAMAKRILDSGMTQAALGKEMGRTQAWANQLVLGKMKDLRWQDGQALIKLDRRVKARLKRKAGAA